MLLSACGGSTTDYAADGKYLGDLDARGSVMRTHLEIGDTQVVVGSGNRRKLQLPGMRTVRLAGTVNGRQR